MHAIANPQKKKKKQERSKTRTFRQFRFDNISNLGSFISIEAGVCMSVIYTTHDAAEEDGEFAHNKSCRAE